MPHTSPLVTTAPVDHHATSAAEPQCPKRCDLATPADAIAPGIFVCTGCGFAFAWPNADADAGAPRPVDVDAAALDELLSLIDQDLVRARAGLAQARLTHGRR